jgi:hypothetical protein
MRSALSISLPGARLRGTASWLAADEAAVFVPVMMAPQKPEAAKRSALPSISIEMAGVVVRAECGVDVGWLAAVLRVMKALA